jgi:hypothetical protein
MEVLAKETQIKTLIAERNIAIFLIGMSKIKS